MIFILTPSAERCLAIVKHTMLVASLDDGHWYRASRCRRPD